MDGESETKHWRCVELVGMAIEKGAHVLPSLDRVFEEVSLIPSPNPAADAVKLLVGALRRSLQPPDTVTWLNSDGNPVAWESFGRPVSWTAADSEEASK